MDGHRELYNAALQERRDAWRQARTRIGYGDQSAQLTRDPGAAPGSGGVVVLQPAGHAAPAQPGVRRFLPAGESRAESGLSAVQRPRRGSTVWSGPRTVTVPAGCPIRAGCICRGVGPGEGHARTATAGAGEDDPGPPRGPALDADPCPVTTSRPTRGRQPGVRLVSMSGSPVSPPPLRRRSRRPIRAGLALPPPRLAAAQQRLARANAGSNNRGRRRETVAARHRKIANCRTRLSPQNRPRRSSQTV